MSKRIKLIPVTMTLVGALALTGCGDDADTDDNAATGANATPTASASESPDQSDEEPGGEGDPVFSAAIATAEATVEGSRAIDYDVDEDDDKIEVQVVVDDIEHELDLSADGSRVLSEEQDDTLDGDDLAEVREATVPITDAVAAALDQQPGTVEEVELDREDGVLRWEVEIRTDSGSTDVHVDATTGDIIG